MGTSEIILKKVEEFRQLCTPHFSFDRAWTKGRALYMRVDESRLVCLRTKSKKLPKAHVVLCACGVGMTVTVVTKDDSFTACDAHNLVVEAFIEECLTEVMMRHLSMKSQEEYESLDSIMSVEAAEALEAWEGSCSTGMYLHWRVRYRRSVSRLGIFVG